MSNLAQYLQRHGITQEKFASRSGITQGFVSRLCRGRIMPRLETAALIERLTDGEVPMSSWVTPVPDAAQPPGASSTTAAPAAPRPAAGTVNPEGGA